MGPRSYERGIATTGGNVAIAWGCFNGAAFLRTRNRRYRSGGSRNRGASMGPRSYERGIIVVAAHLDAQRRASMGPRSYERGIYAGFPARRGRRRRFNGAAFLRTRNPVYHDRAEATPAGLQWGRVLTNAESFATDVAVGPRGLASMGPRSYERGIMISPRPSTRCTTGFNGAAFLRTRNRRRWWGRAPRQASFNGAAFLRTRNPGAVDSL